VQVKIYILKVLISVENAPLTTSPPLAQRSLLSNLADDAYSFLQNHPWHDDPIENDFGAAIATGKLVLQAARNNPTIFQKFADYALDVHFHHSTVEKWRLTWHFIETIEIFIWNPFLEYTPPGILPRGT
jgi:hypothetical protein